MGTVAKLPVPEVVRAIEPMTDPAYTDAYGVDISGAEPRSPEQWARATFEGAPATVRRLLLIGWRSALGLRLGPRPSRDHVLGWHIRDRDTSSISVEVHSWFLTAHLVFWLDDTRLVLSSAVRYDRRFAAAVWPPVSLVHRLAVPYLLQHAVTASRRAATR